MNIGQAFKMAMKSIFDNKGRSILTMLGIIIGVTSVVIMVSLVQGQTSWFQEYYDKMGANKLSINAYTYNGTDITEELYEYCMGLDGLVVGVTPEANVSVNGGIRYKTITTDDMEDAYVNVYMGSHQYSICNEYEIAQGRDLSYLDIEKYNQVIVLGSQVKDHLFGVQDPIGKTVTLNGENFTVIGVFEAKDPDKEFWGGLDDIAVIPYSLSDKMNAWFSQYTVKAAGKEETVEASTMIQGFLKGLIPEGSGSYNVWSENQGMESMDEGTRMASLVAGGIGGISLLVGGIGIMNIMLVTVTERTREIGIRKAIGGSRWSIVSQFLIEASVICCVGGFWGVAFGYLGTVVLGKLMMDMFILPSLGLTIFALAFSVGLGVIFGLYPAIKASGLQPVEALRAD